MVSFPEEGVSPVVGVLLLVCLTVVMVGMCGVMFAGLMPSEMDTRYVGEMERKFFWGSGNSESLIEGPNLYPIEKITIQYNNKYPLLIQVKNQCDTSFFRKNCSFILYVNGVKQDLGPLRLNMKNAAMVSVSGQTESEMWDQNGLLWISIKKEILKGDLVNLSIYQDEVCVGMYEGVAG